MILFDRVLHMLDSDETRTAVLFKSCDHLYQDGTILIADTPKNQPHLHNFFASHPADWKLVKKKNGVLIAQQGA